MSKQPDYFQQGHGSRLVLDIIASKWAVLIVCALQHDTKRFSTISKVVGGITQKVLTDTLRKLERDGIVERAVYAVVPPKVEYKLTPLGTELLEICQIMAQWAENHTDQINRARNLYDRRKT